MIQPDVVELLESGCALKVGTVDAAGLPEATRGWGVRAGPAGEEIRVLVAADAHVTLENLRETGRVAVTATDVATLRSVQVKGPVPVVEPAGPGDREVATRFVDEFFDAIAANDGTPRALLERLVPGGFAAFVVAVEELYDQTPGPAAGARLAPSGA